MHVMMYVCVQVHVSVCGRVCECMCLEISLWVTVHLLKTMLDKNNQNLKIKYKYEGKKISEYDHSVLSNFD